MSGLDPMSFLQRTSITSIMVVIGVHHEVIGNVLSQCVGGARHPGAPGSLDRSELRHDAERQRELEQGAQRGGRGAIARSPPMLLSLLRGQRP